MLKEEKFYAKILLFGEHTLMYGSQALSIPYFERYGYFSFTPTLEKSLDSVSHLRRFANYLKGLPRLPLDVQAFEKDIDSGMVFNTNTPLNYGLGSSGSLVAAVYARYGTDKISKEITEAKELKVLKQIFSEMESCFHGKSSGLDPLICYLQKAITIDHEGNLSLVSEKSLPDNGEGAVFLLDSGQSGETQKMVHDFASWCQSAEFLKHVQQELIPATNSCIQFWIASEKELFFDNIKTLSVVTLKLLTSMVPKGFETIWRQGLENDDYYLKLCGSGGGGMILGFTRKWQETRELLKEHPVYLVQQL